MKIFHRYILNLYLKYLIIVQLFVTIMSLFSSAMGDSKMLAGNDFSFIQFALLQVYSVTLNINIVMPITTTVATIIVILLLMRSNELLAYVSLGGTIASLAIPFITIGIAISAGMISIEYKIMPKTRELREKLIHEMRGETYMSRSGFFNLWLIDGREKLVNIDLINTADKEINGLMEYYFNDQGQIDKIESTNTIKYNNGNWNAADRKIYDMSKNPPTVTIIDNGSIQNRLIDDLFKVNNTDIRSLSPKELSTMGKVLEKRGINVSKYKNILYAKYANALSVIVLLILTFPIAINFSRNYSLIKNAAITFIMGLLYWLFQAVCASLGKTAVLSPFLANFLPLMLFAMISVVIVYRRERAR